MYVRMYVYTYKCTDILYPIYHKYWTLLIIFIIPDIARSSEYLGGLGEGVVPQVVLSDLDMSQSEVPLSPAKTHVVWAPDIQENTLFIGFHGKTMIVYDKYRIWKKKLCWYWIFVGKREKKEHRWQTWVFAGNTIIINSTSLYNDRPSDFAVPSHLDPFGNSYCGWCNAKPHERFTWHMVFQLHLYCRWSASEKPSGTASGGFFFLRDLQATSVNGYQQDFRWSQ